MCRNCLLFVLGILSLVGCASAPEKPLTERERSDLLERHYERDYEDGLVQTVALRHSSIKIVNRQYRTGQRYADASFPNLMVLTKTDKVLLNTFNVAAVLASYGMTDRRTIFEAMHEISPPVRNPVFRYFSPKFRDWVASLNIAGKAYNGDRIYIQPGVFYLTYQKGNGKNFILHNELAIYVGAAKRKGEQPPGLRCVRENGGYGLKQWQADDYALVKEIAERQLDECLEYFKRDENRDSLLDNLLNDD